MIIHRYDGTNLIELSPSVLLSGARGCGKKTVISTVARKLYVHVMEVKVNQNKKCKLIILILYFMRCVERNCDVRYRA